jgi:glycerol-1-phosphate dehydrogenase [NAD(P)+]
MVAAPLTIDVRSGAVAGLGGLLSDRRISAHGDVALVVGPGQGEHVLSVLDEALDDSAEVFPVNGGTIDAAQRLADALRQGSHDAVVGIGGGRTLDVAKFAASQVGLPMVSVATSLAHDGLASPVASLEHGGHKGSYGSTSRSASSSTSTTSAARRSSSCAPASATRSRTSTRSRTGGSPAR